MEKEPTGKHSCGKWNAWNNTASEMMVVWGEGAEPEDPLESSDPGDGADPSSSVLWF